ncbi:DUF1702 family protein [Streptomyces sp. NPDC090445]|uniref:DUF1702 family protein n=1 Tax=Streptomyces sp. NPDC090445 TaxID=3365963 RepID=UPI003816137C
MPTLLGSLRRLLMAPTAIDVSFATRGFPVERNEATHRLEAIPQAVVCGFEWAIDDPGTPGPGRADTDTELRIRLMEPDLRGFAYEGAAMALTVRDAMGPGRGGRTRRLLLGPARPHIFLAYIGVGFALARLPRPLWRKAVPDLTGADYPQMSWLVVDGYGFDRAYFDTATVVDGQKRLPPYPWEGDPDYFGRAVDQGIGRALWFMHGANAPAVAAAVGRFASERHADLWSGAGLAATFAGCCPPAGLEALRRAAGEHAGELAQGAVFAAKARARSGTVPEHTHTALTALAGLDIGKAVALADDCTADRAAGPGRPAYEQWRRNVRERLAEMAG